MAYSKTDFTQLDTTPTTGFFARLRAHVIQAGQNGVYVSVMLFNADEFEGATGSTDGNPFESANNVNGVNCTTTCPITLPLPTAVATYEQAYMQKVVDTVHDLPNVL